MRPPRGLSLGLVGICLIGAGSAYFLRSVGALGANVPRLALLLAAGIALVEAVRRLDPAWLLSTGIVSTMFAGHWDLMGLNASVGPDRILLAAGVLALLLRMRGSSVPRMRPNWVHVALGAALAYALISAIAAQTIGQRTALFDLIDQFGALPFFMFVIAPVAFHSEAQRRIFLGSLVAAGAYLSLTAVFEKLGPAALVVPHYISNPAVGLHFGRARGPFTDAGADGSALCACIAAAGVSLVIWRNTLARLAALGVVLLGLVAVLLTETRAAWVAGIAAALVLLLGHQSLRRFLLPAALAGILVVGGAMAVVPGLAQQVQQRQNDQSSVWERQNTTAAGLRMIAARPLLGFGWFKGNSAMEPYFRVNPRIPLTGAEAGFHNTYLQYAVTLGLVGFALWLLAVFGALGGGLVRRQPRTLEPWRVGQSAVLAAWLAIGLAGPADYIFTTLVLWTWGGITYGSRLWSQEPVGATTWRWSQGNPRSNVLGYAPPKI